VFGHSQGEVGCGLVSLDVRGNKITDSGAKSLFSAVQRFTSLTDLHMDANDLSEDMAKPLASLLNANNLRSLAVGPVGGTDGIKHIAQALHDTSALTALAFSSPRLATSEGMKTFAQAIAANHTLHSLALHRSRLTDESLKILAHGTPTSLLP